MLNFVLFFKTRNGIKNPNKNIDVQLNVFNCYSMSNGECCSINVVDVQLVANCHLIIK